MDFLTISNLIQASGYNITNTSSKLIDYSTTFTRGSDKIIVNWKLRGYVSSVSVSESGKVTSTFDSAEEFIKLM